MKALSKFGWNEFFQSQLDKQEDKNLLPGRISAENKTNFSVRTEFGEITAESSGKLIFTSDDNSRLPKVGDWVLMNYFEDEQKGIIQLVLERKSKLSRKSAGSRTEEQVFAANIDYVLIVHPVDSTYNKNKLERQLVASYQSKAEPIVILSKSDLCNNKAEILSGLKSKYNVKMFFTSAETNEGIDELKDEIKENKTYVLLGSSGAGKSSLINKLFGEEILKTNEVREGNRKGKHTTTRREMIELPSGGILIDNPGIRELQLWNSVDGLNNTFGLFGEFEDKCKFKDCTHTHEVGCAVIEAVENNLISRESYENYLKMRKELEYLETKQNDPAAIIRKKKWKSIKKNMKWFYKEVKGKDR